MEPWIFVFEKNCSYKKLLIKKTQNQFFLMHLRCIDLWQVCEKNNNTGNSYCNVKSVSIKKASSIAETRSENWMLLD